MSKIFLVLILFFSGVLSGVASASTGPVDVIAKVRSNSAEQFRTDIYKSVLLSNYKLSAHSYKLATPVLFSHVSRSEPLLREFIGERIFELCRARSIGFVRCNDARAVTLSTDDYWAVPLSEQSHAFAAWLFSLEGDNWFQLTDAELESAKYLDSSLRSLVMLPGFNPDGVLVDLLNAPGLPVVIDAEEQTITIWLNELAD